MNWLTILADTELLLFKQNSMSFQCCSCCIDVWIPEVTIVDTGLG